MNGLTTAGPTLRLTPRRLALLALFGLLIVAVLVLAGGARETWNALVHADWRLIGLALIVHYSGFAVRGHRWQLLLGALNRGLDNELHSDSGEQTARRPGYLYTTSILLSGWFVSALLPARAGDVFRIAALRQPPAREPRIPVAASLSSIILERTFDIFALLLLSAGFGVTLLGAHLPGWLGTLYAGGLALLILGLGLLIGMPSLLARLQGVLPGDSDNAGRWRRWWRKGIDLLGEVSISTRAVSRHPLLVTGALVESLYIWLCDGLLLWLVLWSLGQSLPFSHGAFVAVTADVFAAVPLTPGGVGQVESAYALLLSLLPGALINIPAAILATRAISYWSFLIVSGMIMFATGLGRLLVTPTPVADGSVEQWHTLRRSDLGNG